MAVAARESAVRGGAKALLLTVLGEFVLPAGGVAWTTSLVAAADALGVGEKNARQAIARIGEDGLVGSSRHGRAVQWTLTDDGRALLDSGARRIYGFGTGGVDWHGTWLVAHCPVAEAHRTVRHRLRTRLGFLGFGELSPSLLISPHLDRDDQLRHVLHELDLHTDSVVLHSTTASIGEARGVVAKAWDLDALAESYRRFADTHDARIVDDERDAFVAVVELVHDWRRFPFMDPELPTSLLPQPWAGTAAAEVFNRCHHRWLPEARRWFDRQLLAGTG